MVLQLEIRRANACQRVKGTDRQLKSDFADADTEPCSSSVLEACLSRFLASAVPSACEQNSVEAEIDRFVSMTPVDRSKFATACDWCRHIHHLYPNVAHVAKHYLCALLMSVASERLFSSASRVFTGRRNRLAPKKADMLLFIKHNLSTWH